MALARAVYARTKYVLLDDPLSAVVRLYLDLYALVLMCLFVFSRIATLRDFCTIGFCVGRYWPIGQWYVTPRLFIVFNYRCYAQILVTHHVELVLPGTFYLIRMLDGRIDTQGTVKDLRARGVLDEIAQDSAADVKSSEPVAASEEPIEAIADESPQSHQGEHGHEGVSTEQTQRKQPRKLVKDEHRERGGVKFSIYKSYMKASYVDI